VDDANLPADPGAELRRQGQGPIGLPVRADRDEYPLE
jgi:hypothetical protein